MNTRLRRRAALGASAVLPFALGLALLGTTTATSATATSAQAGAAQAKAPTTGRFVTTTAKGVVLVDEDGGRPHVIVPATRRSPVSLAQVNDATGTVLYSTQGTRNDGATRTTWHVTNLYGTALASFTVPTGARPVLDSGGYTAYWVRSHPRRTALMKLEVHDPNGTPSVVRRLNAELGAILAVSPDDRFVAAATLGYKSLPGSLWLIATDGSTYEQLPVPTGHTLVATRPLWSPDSSRVAFETTSSSEPGFILHTAAVVGDRNPTRVGAAPGQLFDWSPDASTILGGVPDSAALVAVDVATGQSHTTQLKRRPVDAPVFWSGLRPGAVPRDRFAPRVRISLPDCGDRKPAACERYRHSVAAWGTVFGRVSDRGGSQLRYVAVALFQRRGDTWWALAGNGGRYPSWQPFPTRNEARYAARERTAVIVGDTWGSTIPGLTRGRLVVVVKAADGAGNNGKHLLAQTLS